ncbi:MAG: hypothetical protein WC793_00480 [Candidatus Paceibacterota bacterium]
MKNNQSGFIQIIIFIIVALLIMKFLGITVSGVLNWFMSFFRGVLR